MSEPVSPDTLEVRCAKVPFRTEGLAWRRLVEIALTEPARRSFAKPIRAYHCQRCGGWHLTRRP